ncbi:MAG: hypothetical protein AB4050_11830 [Synechococcus sp.]
MDQLLKNISSFSWWVSVVFVGILVSLIAAYIKPLVDKSLGELLLSYQNLNQSQQKKREIALINLRDSKEEQILHLLQANTHMIRAVLSLLLG